MASPSRGAFSLTSDVATGAGNANTIRYLDFPSQSNSALLSFNKTYQFPGLSGSGASETMTYSATAADQSNYGALSSQFSATLANTIYNPSNPSFINSQPGGVPDLFVSQANAEFQDKVTVQGGPGLTSIEFVLEMKGNVSSNDQTQGGTSGAIAQVFPDGTSQIPYAFSEGIYGTGSTTGSVDSQVTSLAYALDGSGRTSIGFILQTISEQFLSDAFHTGIVPDGSTLTGSSNFTMNVVGVIGLNATGGQVALSSVVGDSGTVYLGSQAVPEPSSLILLSLGGLAVGAARLVRRRP